jgi:hypothetical protein
VSGAAVDSSGALEAVDRILNRGGNPNHILREILEAVHARGVDFARIRLFDGDRVIEAFTIGSGATGSEALITYAGARVGALEVAADDPAFVERLATLVSAVCAERAQHFRRR